MRNHSPLMVRLTCSSRKNLRHGKLSYEVKVMTITLVLKVNSPLGVGDCSVIYNTITKLMALD